MIVVRTAGCRGDQRFMIPEHCFISQIEIVVADLSGCFRIALMFSQCIVKCGIQMVILPADPHNIPSVTVLDPFLRIVPQIAITHHTPNASQSTFTDLAMPSQTPTPCPSGPIISWE